MRGLTTETYYKIVFPNNTCYIGRSDSVDTRYEAHKVKVNNGIHLNSKVQEVYDKYGLDGWSLEKIYTATGDNSFHSQNEFDLIQLTPNTLNKYDGRYTLLSGEEKSEYQKNASSEHYYQNHEYYKKLSRDKHTLNKEQINLKKRQKRLGPEGDEIRRKEREAYNIKNKNRLI